MHEIKMPTLSCTGKCAVVTGAGSGIGQAAALMLGYYGAKVVAADLDFARAKETAFAIQDRGGDAIACGWTCRTPGWCAPWWMPQ